MTKAPFLSEAEVCAYPDIRNHLILDAKEAKVTFIHSHSMDVQSKVFRGIQSILISFKRSSMQSWVYQGSFRMLECEWTNEIKKR